MERVRVLLARPVPEQTLAGLRERHPGVSFDVREPSNGNALTAADADEASVLFADYWPNGLGADSAVRWMQLGSAGYRQLAGADLPADLAVCTASGVNDVPIAEWCLLAVLAFGRDLLGMLSDAGARRWNRAQRYQDEVRGHRVGIFGYGSIGRQVDQLCRAVGLETWVLSRNELTARTDRYGSGWHTEPVPHRVFRTDRVEDFLAGLDYLVLTAALNPSTLGYFTAERLAKLPAHAVLVNPARAQLVDEQALLTALREGTIRGAALDSHYREPMPRDDPFWELPNALVTPHISGSTLSPNYERRLWELFELNLNRFRTGRRLLNLVDPTDLAVG